MLYKYGFEHSWSHRACAPDCMWYDSWLIWLCWISSSLIILLLYNIFVFFLLRLNLYWQIRLANYTYNINFKLYLTNKNTPQNGNNNHRHLAVFSNFITTSLAVFFTRFLSLCIHLYVFDFIVYCASVYIFIYDFEYFVHISLLTSVRVCNFSIYSILLACTYTCLSIGKSVCMWMRFHVYACMFMYVLVCDTVTFSSWC